MPLITDYPSHASAGAGVASKEHDASVVIPCSTNTTYITISVIVIITSFRGRVK